MITWEESVGSARSARWSHVRDVTRIQGLAAGLGALYEVCDATAPVYGPSGYALIPRVLDPGGSAQVVIPAPAVLEESDIVVVRTLDFHGRGGGPAAWAIGLVGLRLAVAETVLSGVVSYLAGRAVGGESLLHQQLVKGALADVTIAHLETETALSTEDEASPALTAELHAKITWSTSMISRLFGAAGFISGGPAHSVHVSDLIADIYIGSDSSEVHE